MAAFSFSFNVIFPIFLVMALGYLLRRLGIINQKFVDIGTKLTFTVTIPCMIFANLIEADINEYFDLPLTIFAVVSSFVTFIVLRLIVPRFIKDAPTWSAYIQGAFRSNYLIIGFALLNAIGGTPALTKGAMLFVFIAPLSNILSVLVLAHAQKDAAGKSLMRSIYTNPVIISTTLAIIFALIGIKLPSSIQSSVAMLGDMALPLSLLTLGGTISFSHDYTNMPQVIWASLIKVLFIPLLFIPLAYAFGFRDIDLIICMVLFATPSAISCFPMAYQMGANYRLTGMIIAVTNTLAIFTLFLFVYVLRATGLI